ncbi:MAG: AtpZ/AtpI family protein [Sphaerochaetaceae bacterium]|nr:AtpZ/AtpI family protein [Sphaerochaetaceae bacterium]
MQKKNNQEEIPKHKNKLEALDSLSLGISIVAAILIGVGIGLLLKSWTGYTWTLWIGVFWGIAAAILNIYKAYKKAKKDLDELADDPRYKHRAQYGDKGQDEDDD